jgi:uncharacterized protein
VCWTTWDGGSKETLRVGYENGGWTAEGTISGADVSYVIRFTEQWDVRQFLLFRDLDEPDLWLATDGTGRWGETNGEPRDDLDGCTAVVPDCTPFAHALAVKRLQMAGSQEHTFRVALLDVETLGLTVHTHTLAQVAEGRWSQRSVTTERAFTFDVDDFGFIVDEPKKFRRLLP